MRERNSAAFRQFRFLSTEFWSSITPHVQAILIPLLASRAAVWLGTELGAFLLQRGAIVPSTHPLDFYSHDANNYREISLHGYTNSRLTAFFPLFPYVVRLLGHVTGDDAAGLILPNVAFAIALVLFRAETQAHLGCERANQSVWVLAIWPWSCFFTYPFTESFFLLAVLLAYRALASRHWMAAGLMGAVASATRFPGVLVALALGGELAQTWRIQGRLSWRLLSRPIIAIGVISLGLVAVGIVDFHAEKDPLAFWHAEQLWSWKRNPLFPLGQVVLMFRDHNPYKTEALGLPVATTFGLAAWWAVRHLPWRYSAYAMGSGLLYVYQGWQQGQFYSVPRWLIVDFPCFMALGVLLGRYQRLRIPWFSMSAALLVVESALYGAHRFIG